MRSIIKWGCICTCLALIFASGMAVGKYSTPAPAQQAAPVSSHTTSDALEAFRTERQQLRQMQLSQLNEMIHSENTSPDISTLAQQRKLELLEWSEPELTLEGVLSMRGYPDSVATVHTDSVNVMVHSESVSRQEAAIILELVTRETGISGGNVKIVPIN